MYASFCRRTPDRHFGIVVYPSLNGVACGYSQVFGRFHPGHFVHPSHGDLPAFSLDAGTACRTYRYRGNYGVLYRSGVFIRNICCCRRLDFFLDGQSDCCFSVCCGDCFSVEYGVGFYRRNTCFRKYSGLCTAFGHQLSL